MIGSIKFENWIAIAVITVMTNGAISSAAAQGIEVVNTWSLNAPSLDCFRTFSQYHHEATGYVYFNAHINCVTGSAFIEYSRRIHSSELG